MTLCHQAVSLIQAELERQGITTASITMLPEITRRLRPPRALAVPYALGYPLGVPAAPDVQLSILRPLLSLCRRNDVPLLEHDLRSPL
jgi:hypothetical protein